MASLDEKLQRILEVITEKAPKLNPRPSFGYSNAVARKPSMDS